MMLKYIMINNLHIYLMLNTEYTHVHMYNYYSSFPRNCWHMFMYQQK